MRKLYYGLISFLLMPIFVLADNTTQTGSGNSGGSSTGFNSGGQPVLTNPLQSNDVMALFNNVVNFLLQVAAPVAVIMAIYAGFLFVTAGDNAEKVKTARKTLMYVIIGVAVLILSKGIVTLATSFLEVKP